MRRADEGLQLAREVEGAGEDLSFQVGEDGGVADLLLHGGGSVGEMRDDGCPELAETA